MENIFELAKQLGEALAEHPIGKKYNDARQMLDKDPAARQAIQDYETYARQLEQKNREGKPIEPEEKRKLAGFQARISGNEAIKKWMEAQVDYMNLLRQINDLVMKENEPEPKA